jgi:tRNA modification GTPase
MIAAGDTIFAVASGSGQAAIALMRISGARSGPILDALCRRRPPPRRAVVRRLRDAEGAVLDQAMVVWLPGPGTYTGEDAAELSVHAGRAVIEDVAQTLVGLGARPAEPGEFTRRAFLHGRLDLTEAEGIADLIAAETSAQRRQALRQMEGALRELYDGWAARLRLAVAQQEALIDFPDEDLPPEEDAAMSAEVAALRAEIAAHLADDRRGERLREGLVFAIVGAPNAGKSSLMNRLAERQVAIVAALPGTTRDPLEARLVLAGVPVTLVDTAGLREVRDAIEAEGVRRARARAAEADCVIAVIAPDAALPEVMPPGASAATVIVANKSDLGWTAPDGTVAISALTGSGIAALRDVLAEHARRLTARSGPPALTRARHRAALDATLARLDAALAAPLVELRAEDLRLALRALGGITGAIGVEAILDTVFSRFCIGK